MTYSIVARDPVTGDLGVAVQSRWFNVGETVPWAEPGVGAVATQSFAERSYGPLGLERMRGGASASEALEGLLAADDEREVRQVGMVDGQGRSAAFSGDRCVFAAGHVTVENLSIQANMMERATVWGAMAESYRASDGELADRLLVALRAAEAEGGDVRGRQSAALLVVPASGPVWARKIDLRVEDHRAPLDELERLLRVARAYEAFGRSQDLVAVGDLASAVTEIEAAMALAPDDDQIALSAAVMLGGVGRMADAQRLFGAALRAEPRAAEHLRRFLAAGHLPAQVGPLIDGLEIGSQGVAPVTRRGLILFGLMSIVWGIPYLFIRVAVDEISPAVLVLVRTSIGAGILLPIALIRSDVRAVLARWRWVVAFAAVEIAIPWVMLGSAEQHLSSSLAGLLIAGVPLVGATLAIATGGADRFGRKGVLGLLIGLAGVLGIVGADFAASDSTAFLEILVVVLGYAVGPAILSRQLAGLPTIGVMALSLALCAVVYLPIAAAQWPAVPPSTNVVGSIVVLGTVCTAAAFLMFAALIAEIGPVRATIITYVNPAVAAVLGVLVLNETLTVTMGMGFALVILGSTLATRPSRAGAEPRPVPTEAATLRPAEVDGPG